MKLRPPKLSLDARILALVVGCEALLLALVCWALPAEQRSELPLLPIVAAVLGVTALAVQAFLRPIQRSLQVLTDAVASLRDGDFSVGLVVQRNDELGRLAEAYNAIVEVLRSERQNLFQRELLLDTVMQSSPQALVLCDARDRVVYSNSAARRLFAAGRKLEGNDFAALLESVPDSLRTAAQARHDGLFSVEIGGEPEIYHVSHSHFRLNTRDHRLLQMRQLTRELTRQELDTWKKVIRVISHELNNSLAPISSLAHSGRQVARQGRPELLDDIFATIEERAQRLGSFLEGYARFAKLPRPRPEDVEWRGFLTRLRRSYPFELRGDVPARIARFDPGQIQQVLINLLKNARDAGSPPDQIEVEVQAERGHCLVRVLDRGSGMTEAVLASSLLPFYSTKSDGSGLGLTLCRDIIEGHGGQLSLANRTDGGLEVRFTLPQEAEPAPRL